MPAAPAEAAGYLPRIFAQRRIDALLADDKSSETKQAEIVKLDMDHFLVTPYTSLLVVENDAMYASFKVARPDDDGWARYPAPKEIPVRYEPSGFTAADLSGSLIMRTRASLGPSAAHHARLRVPMFLPDDTGVSFGGGEGDAFVDSSFGGVLNLSKRPRADTWTVTNKAANDWDKDRSLDQTIAMIPASGAPVGGWSMNGEVAEVERRRSGYFS